MRRPAGFMSKKLTNAQKNYCVYEYKMLTILQALLKWEDKLLDYEIYIATDHKALEFLDNTKRFNSYQSWWMEYLACFKYKIIYVQGMHNLVADAMS
jgi:hypothetical protein